MSINIRDRRTSLSTISAVVGAGIFHKDGQVWMVEKDISTTCYLRSSNLSRVASVYTANAFH